MVDSTLAAPKHAMFRGSVRQLLEAVAGLLGSMVGGFFCQGKLEASAA